MPTEPAMPVIVIKPVLPNMKFILINGEKVGALHRSSQDNSLYGRDSARREILWSGEFVFHGKTVHVGRTVKVADLLPKVTSLVRSLLIRHADQGIANEAAGRAQLGGEIGVNGYAYKGGQFLPSTDAPPGTWRVKIKGKARLISSKNELVAPGVLENSPTPFSRAIFGIIKQIVSVNPDGSLSVIDNPAAVDYYGRDIVPGVNGIQGTGRYDVEELVELYNKGARWIDVTPADAEIIAKG